MGKTLITLILVLGGTSWAQGKPEIAIPNEALSCELTRVTGPFGPIILTCGGAVIISNNFNSPLYKYGTTLDSQAPLAMASILDRHDYIFSFLRSHIQSQGFQETCVTTPPQPRILCMYSRRPAQ